MESQKNKKRQRADDQTILSFSCPKVLKEALLRAAKDEDRNLSNFLCHHLKKMMAEIPEFKIHAADTRSQTNSDANKTEQ